ncbi:hypothetical protein CEXT_81451 [Caerostris extrusa]|uniref:Uncharacterized protein n=1 Tax=Caerostris extrusa TaxID=172846 RepID=A0AAV4RPT3_CAEEX|nr:hypothetical protein CEXT_81451 [Caerostris extrusa]
MSLDEEMHDSRIDRCCSVHDKVSEYFPPLFSADVSTPLAVIVQKEKTRKKEKGRNKRKTLTLATAVRLCFLNNQNNKAKGNKNIKRKCRVFFFKVHLLSAFQFAVHVQSVPHLWRHLSWASRHVYIDR